MLKTISRNIEVAIENAYQAELRGDYLEGLESLSFFWDYKNPGAVPFDEFENSEFADILLRIGALYGFYGSAKQKAQETSKDFLTVAYRLFDQNSITEKCAACSNYMALAYWRMGATGEADFWCLNAFIYDLPEDHPFRLHSHIVRSLINTTNSRFSESLAALEGVRHLFEKTSSLYLRACFYVNLAIAEKELNLYSEALNNFDLAIKYFTKLNNRRYLSYTENNIALVHKKLLNINEAYAHAEKSLQVAAGLDDQRQIGCVYDTLARIAFTDGQYEIAGDYSDKAIATLTTTETYGYLVEAYETKIRSLIELNRFSPALLAYGEGLQIARIQTSPEIVEAFTERISQMFQARSLIKIKQESGFYTTDELIELVYPENFAPPSAPAGVEVMTNRLRAFGLEKGALAIIDEEAGVKNGDLISIHVPKIGARLLGVLCFFEDMVLLEFGDGSTPISFMKNEVKLMGKVIGYCNVLPDGDGKVSVRVLEG